MKQKLTALVLALVMAFSLAPAASATTNNLEISETFLENMNSVGAPYFFTEENE